MEVEPIWLVLVPNSNQDKMTHYNGKPEDIQLHPRDGACFIENNGGKFNYYGVVPLVVKVTLCVLFGVWLSELF